MDGKGFLAWREKLELTQQAAATILGVSRRTLQSREQGEVPVPRETELACLWLAEHADQIPALLRTEALAQSSYVLCWTYGGDDRVRQSPPVSRVVDAKHIADRMKAEFPLTSFPQQVGQMRARVIEKMWIEDGTGTAVCSYGFVTGQWLQLK